MTHLLDANHPHPAVRSHLTQDLCPQHLFSVSLWKGIPQGLTSQKFRSKHNDLYSRTATNVIADLLGVTHGSCWPLKEEAAVGSETLHV